jgi:pyridoxal phosphate enzyme (YggS family)
MSDARRDELAKRLTDVHNRVAGAAEAAGRSPADVTLVVVTKTWPADDVRRLHDLGVRDFAENRAQEAEHKAADLADLPLTWHFVGQIQSNKAARLAAFASVVHSVSSVRVATRLELGADRHQRAVDCLVQVNLDPEDAGSGRGGVPPDEAAAVADAVESQAHLRLVGVMGVAPLGADPQAAYQQLAGVAADLRSAHPQARLLSAGMSGDFEAAIFAGATHVRVGSAVLGERPPNR